MEYLLCDVEGAVVGANVFVNRDLGVEFFGKQIVAEVTEPVVPQASRELKDRRIGDVERAGHLGNGHARCCAWVVKNKTPDFLLLGGEVGHERLDF